MVLINLCLNLLGSCWAQLRRWRNQPLNSDSLQFFFLSLRAGDSELVLYIHATRQLGNDQVWQLCTSVTLGRYKKTPSVIRRGKKTSQNLQLRFRFISLCASVCVCVCVARCCDTISEKHYPSTIKFLWYFY